MSNPDEFTSEDAEIAALLREVGPRAEPTDAAMREVEAAVRAEWQQVVAVRKRRMHAWVATAAVCVVSISAFFGLQQLWVEPVELASLAHADGIVFIAHGDADWQRVVTGQRISTGDRIRSEGHAALELDTGLAVRIDRGTSLAVVARDRLALNEGAVYVDSSPGAKAGDLSDDLVIATHVGDVRHLGTQYQVRSHPDSIEISVREGRVIIQGEGGQHLAAAGERLDISTHGAVARSQIPTHDPSWAWANEAAPAFVIENQSLAAFLKWAARETGRPLKYESTQAESAAATVILHGSIDGLALSIAIDSVLATTPLRRDQGNPDSIAIGFATPVDSPSTQRPTP